MSLITQHNLIREDVEIETFESEYVSGERVIDPWQRLDGWSLSFKMLFIKAILCGSDIPKIMEYTLLGDPLSRKRILDGGHRCRAIHEFKASEFGVVLSDNNCYWWDHDETRVRKKGQGQNRKLPQEYKDMFNSYNLSCTTYLEITDKDARVKFNELNNCSPMKIHEVINSHCSQLIDFMRKEWSSFIGSPGNHEFKHIQKMFCLTPSSMSDLKHMKIIAGLFSIIHRKGEADEYGYCQPGDALRYVRANNGDNEPFSTQFSVEEMTVVWPKFTDGLEKFYATMDRINVHSANQQFKLANHSEALSYFGYINNHMGIVREEDIEMFIRFHGRCEKYRVEEKAIAKKLNSVKDSATFTQLQTDMDLRKEAVGQPTIDWLATTNNNGSGQSNLRKRKNILDIIFGH